MTPLTLNIGLKPKPAPRPRGKGPVHNPTDYTAWKTAFGFLALEQLRIALRNGQPMPSAAAPVELHITLTPTSVQVVITETAVTRPKGLTFDLDNAAKAVSDALQDCGIIQNDRQVQRLVVEFAGDPE